MELSLIAAVALNNVIGKDGSLAWHIPDDLKHFRALTTGHTVIMGRLTYEGIGTPLSDRTNIVVTHRSGYTAPGCLIAHSLEEAFTLADRQERGRKTFIIGGGEIFWQTVERAAVVYLTLIHRTAEGDTYFPELGAAWEEVDREDHYDALPDPYSFITYERRTVDG